MNIKTEQRAHIVIPGKGHLYVHQRWGENGLTTEYVLTLKSTISGYGGGKTFTRRWQKQIGKYQTLAEAIERANEIVQMNV